MTGKTHRRTSRVVTFSLALIVVWCLGIGIAGCTEKRVENLIQKLGEDVLTGSGHQTVKDLVRIGEPAVEALIVALDSPDILVRIRAARALGQIGDLRAVEPLVAALDDPDVRGSAAEALGRIGDPRAVEPLVAVLDDPYWLVREEVARALDQIGDPRAVEPLFAAFEKELVEGSPKVGMVILEALVAMDDARATDAAMLVLGSISIPYQEASQKILADAEPQAVVAALVNSLSNPDERVRTSAAELLAEMDEEATVDVLLDSLSNPDERVRTASIQLLAEMSEEATVDVLVDGLSNPDERVRTASIQLLAEMSEEAGEAAVETLVASLHGNDQAVAVAALEALRAMLEGKHGDVVLGSLDEVVDPLIAFLEHQNEEVRAEAAWLLARTDDSRAVDALYSVRQHQDQSIRWAALRMLVKRGDSRASDALIDELAGDMTNPLQKYAADVLANMGSRVLEPLIVALQSGDEGRRSQIARVLGEIGDAGAVPALVALLDDESDVVRLGAVIALGDIGDTAGLEPLIKSCQDESGKVRRAAAAGLNRMDDSALAPLLKALKSKDLAIVTEAYLFFIFRGEAGSEALLIMALSKYGTKQMALDYLNSGYTPLEEAGDTWAKEHGYVIFSLPTGAGSGDWGSAP